MGAKRTDISQIRKYLNGELNGRAMHQLEREAQDDPFLMDAIAGYEEATGLQQRQLNDLDSRLQQRVSQSKIRKIIPWKYYAAAASVLIMFSLGYLVWPGTQVPEKKQVTVNPPAAADHPVTVPDTLLAPAKQENLIAANPVPSVIKRRQPEYKSAAPAVKPDAEVAPDMSVASEPKTVADESYSKKSTVNPNYGYIAKNSRPDTSLFVRKAVRQKDSTILKEVTILGREAIAKNDVTGNGTYGLSTQTLQGKVPGAQVTTPKKISGTVLSDLGLPLPGASVIVDGTKKATQTDAQGRFSISADGQAMLDVRSIGYQTRQIKANPDDSLKIALNPDNQSLSEVAIVNYGKFKDAKAIKEAHPQTGWDNYNQYLKRGTKVTEGATGTVAISFTVGTKGALGDFVITKGLTEVLNNKAIELVKSGPAWAPDASGKPKTVKLKVEFAKE